MNKTLYITTLLIIGALLSPVVAKNTSEKKSKPSKSRLSFFQKARLNDPIMTIDFGSHRAKLDQHIYQVREGSIGGYDAVGGNCGCN